MIVKKCIAAGASDYIMKPVDTEQLHLTVTGVAVQIDEALLDAAGDAGAIRPGARADRDRAAAGGDISGNTASISAPTPMHRSGAGYGSGSKPKDLPT